MSTSKTLSSHVSNCILRIDYRERELLSQFSGENPAGDGWPWRIIRENLLLGDIVLEWQCNESDKFELICERKSIDDFAASITDGRYHEQKSRLLLSPLRDGFTKRYIAYFIEGPSFTTIESTPTTMNSRRTRDSTKSMRIMLDESTSITSTPTPAELVETQWNVKHGFSRVTYSTMISAMFSTMIRDNIHVIRVQNPEELAMWLVIIMQKISRKGEEISEKSTNIDEKLEHIGGIISAKRKDNIISTPQQCFRMFLCQIPGMSTTFAQPIIDRFESMANLIKEWTNDGESHPQWLSELMTHGTKPRRIGNTLSEKIHKMLFGTT